MSLQRWTVLAAAIVLVLIGRTLFLSGQTDCSNQPYRFSRCYAAEGGVTSFSATRQFPAMDWACDFDPPNLNGVLSGPLLKPLQDCPEGCDMTVPADDWFLEDCCGEPAYCRLFWGGFAYQFDYCYEVEMQCCLSFYCDGDCGVQGCWNNWNYYYYWPIPCS
jgi:hypothetical protein